MRVRQSSSGSHFAEFRIEFDHPVRPPRAAGGGLHARVPGDAHLAGKFRQGEAIRGFRTPSGEAAVVLDGLGWWRCGSLQDPEPRGPSEFKLRHAPAH